MRGPFSANTTTVGGSQAPNAVEIQGTTAFTNPATVVGDLTVIGSITAEFSPTTGPQTLALGSVDLVSFATLTGTDNFTVSGPLTMGTAVTLGGPAGSVLDAYGGVDFDGSGSISTLDGRTLNNYAAATWQSGDVAFANGAVFNNLAGATFLDEVTSVSFQNFGDALDVENPFQPGSGLFNNAGSFIQQGPLGTNFFAPFANTGSVDVQVGTLDLFIGATNAGTVTVAAGATLSVGRCTQTAAVATTLNGGTLANGPLRHQRRCPDRFRDHQCRCHQRRPGHPRRHRCRRVAHCQRLLLTDHHRQP